MPKSDLNLLIALDALLAEGSVAGAARRLKLSPSAMSRTLARLREATGDPLLVRAGRGLVPTPRAIEIQETVGQLVLDANAVLSPAEALNLEQLERTFTLRTGDGFVETFGFALFTRIQAEAPGIRLRFVQKSERDNHPLRDGSVDLEIGVVRETTGPELRTQALFQERFAGVVRQGHPLSEAEITPARYAQGQHVDIWQHVPRDDLNLGPIDGSLATMGLRRNIAIIVGGFSSALALARESNLIATVPERQTRTLCAGMVRFDLPFPTPKITLSMLWHPRLDADAVHRWLRAYVREVCLEQCASPRISEVGKDQ